MKESIYIYIYRIAGQCIRLLNKLSFPAQKDIKTIIQFDTSIGTENLGDHIIMHYCQKVLNELFPGYTVLHISTHSMPSKEQEYTVKHHKYKFVCGTNLLTSNIEHHWRWILPDGIRRKFHYRNAILLGVGWSDYQGPCSDYSRMIYKTILNPHILHSVRDQYTLAQLQSANITNVINTGCPTTWALTPDFCKEIPSHKSPNVITTITDYRQDPECDNEMLAILSKNYEHIYLWLQGNHDAEYLQNLNIPTNLTTIPGTLDDYETYLRSGRIDYVGTRLHAGIHALNYKIRSIILAVDNRATEMARDINLPIIQRDAISVELEKMINSDFSTQIQINQNNIDLFKSQFRKS